MKIIEEKHDFVLNSHIWSANHINDAAHWHDNVEIIQILDNKCNVLVDGKIIEAKAGDIVIVKGQSIHRVSAEFGTYHFRVVQFSYKIFFDMNKSIGNLQTYIPYEAIQKIPNLEKKLNNLFEITDIEGKEKYIGENPFYQFVLMAIYTLLVRHFSAMENEAPNRGEQDEFYRIVDYINHHYREDISIQSIAKSLYVSRSRMTRLFNKYSGMSISEYITDLRIKKANHLIASGHSVTEAAIDSGFQSVRTFNSVYKSHMGITPTEYQKKCKTN